MDYKEQLLDFKWKQKRKNIINRDKSICQVCLNKKILRLSKPALILGMNSDRESSIWDIEDDKKTFAKYLGHPINFKENKSILCYYLPNNTPKLISGILNHSIESETKKPYTLNLDDDSPDDVYSFFHNYYGVGKAIEFLKEKKLESLEWDYIFNLHVHHKYYQSNLKAWEYPDESLITLCWDCHEELHKNTLIPILSNDEVEGYLTPCSRCYGAGELPEFIHIQSGICFKCDGAKYEELIKVLK